VQRLVAAGQFAMSGGFGVVAALAGDADLNAGAQAG